MLTKKRILIVLGIFLVVVAVTVGVLIVLKPKTTVQVPELTRGIKLTDNIVFNKVSNVTGLPTFSQTPTNDKGWITTPTTGDTRTNSVRLNNSSNGCSISIASQRLPFTNKDLADLALSKSYANTIATSEQGTIGDEYVIKIKSTQGDVDFYTGIYNPKVQLTRSDSTTQTKEGGSVKLDGNYTTLLAVRSIAVQLPDSTDTSKTALPADSKYTKGQIVNTSSMIPSIVISYTCKAAAFNADDAVNTIKQINLDFVKVQKTQSTTTGK